MFLSPRIRILLQAGSKLTLGIILGVVLLELIFKINPHILLRGMPAPAPVDHPLTRTSYIVHYSDADVFEWRPDLIQPVSPEQNLVEANVVYQTDEFGFRNSPGLPEFIDVVVLGRSTSAGAQVNEPWPSLLKSEYGQETLNLSQPSSDIYGKLLAFNIYGKPRNPRWLIIEINPQLDFIGIHRPNPLVSQLPVPIYQQIANRFNLNQNESQEHAKAVFPLTVMYPKRNAEIVCCTHYMEFYSLDRQSLQKSRDWSIFTNQLLNIVKSAAESNTCVALLYVPVKQVVYLSDISETSQLSPIFQSVHPYLVDDRGNLSNDLSKTLSPDTALNNLFEAKELIQSFAAENNLFWIDPTQAMLHAYHTESDPFMKYDNHWNQLGHQIIANIVIESINSTYCP